MIELAKACYRVDYKEALRVTETTATQQPRPHKHMGVDGTPPIKNDRLDQ